MRSPLPRILMYFGAKSFSTSMPNWLFGRSRRCPMDARTMYFLPRYFSIVFAFAGDSTTTKVCGASFFAAVFFAAVFFATVFFAAVFFGADFFAAGFFSAADVVAVESLAADFLVAVFFAEAFFTADFFAAGFSTAAVFAAPFPAALFPSFFSACPTTSLFFSCGVFFCAVGKIAPPQLLDTQTLFPLALRMYVRMGVSSTRPLTRSPSKRNATFAALPCRRQISSSRESAASRERSA